MFEAHLAISAILCGEKPDTHVPFSHAAQAYKKHRIPEDAAKPTVLHGEILPPEPTREELLAELYTVAGWKMPNDRHPTQTGAIELTLTALQK